MDMLTDRVTLFEGKHLRLVRVGRWEYAERTKANGAVMILAVTTDDKLILIEQFRLPLGKPVIELPAGLAGDILGQETEAMATAAQRELREETGYEAREFVHLVTGPPSSGLSSEVVSLYRALDVSRPAAVTNTRTSRSTKSRWPTLMNGWLGKPAKERSLIRKSMPDSISPGRHSKGGVVAPCIAITRLPRFHCRAYSRARFARFALYSYVEGRPDYEN